MATAPLLEDSTNIFMRSDLAAVITDMLAKHCRGLSVDLASIPPAAQLSRFVADTSIRAVRGLFGEAICTRIALLAIC